MWDYFEAIEGQEPLVDSQNVKTFALLRDQVDDSEILPSEDPYCPGGGSSNSGSNGGKKDKK